MSIPDSLFPEPAATPSEPVRLTVSELNQIVREAIQTALPGLVHVIGEISNVSRPAGGHIYFTLKDASSEIRCVMWRSSAQGMKFDLNDGLEVIATGTVEVFEPRGQYQLYVRRLEPRGVGSLELAFRQLKEKLNREGLFKAERKRPLPRFPTRIAIVTSLSGAALRDILQTIHRRYRFVEVFVHAVRVQGEGAAGEVAHAIKRINRVSAKLGGIDVMIVGRGGGSLEDLWAFNEEIVARAIHASTIPIISGVGHEIDVTIADFVADVRAATPTAAAELAVPLMDDLLDGLDAMRDRLLRAIHRRFETARVRFAAVEKSAWFRDPGSQLLRRSQQVDEILVRLRFVLLKALAARRQSLQTAEVRFSRGRPSAQIAARLQRLAKIDHRLRIGFRDSLVRCQRQLERIGSRVTAASPRSRAQSAGASIDRLVKAMTRSMERLVADHRKSITTLATRLSASSHQQVLNRGFSITRRQSGEIVRKGDEVRKGDILLTETAEGEIESQVTQAKGPDKPGPTR